MPAFGNNPMRFAMCIRGDLSIIESRINCPSNRIYNQHRRQNQGLKSRSHLGVENHFILRYTTIHPSHILISSIISIPSVNIDHGIENSFSNIQNRIERTNNDNFNTTKTSRRLNDWRILILSACKCDYIGNTIASSDDDW